MRSHSSGERGVEIGNVDLRDRDRVGSLPSVTVPGPRGEDGAEDEDRDSGGDENIGEVVDEWLHHQLLETKIVGEVS